MGQNHFTAAPTALYGVVLLMAAIGYLRSSAGNHPRPRARFNSQEGSWARLEGKVISSAVCRGDPCNVTCNLDRSGDLCVGCADLADSGPAYRKTPCLLNA